MRIAVTAWLALAAALIYLLPTIIASARKVPGTRPIILLNVLLGWSVLGWALVLWLSVRRPAPRPRQCCCTRLTAGRGGTGGSRPGWPGMPPGWDPDAGPVIVWTTLN